MICLSLNTEAIDYMKELMRHPASVAAEDCCLLYYGGCLLWQFIGYGWGKIRGL